MSWESRGEDGDGGEQTPGHGQPLFELAFPNSKLKVTFSAKERGRKGKGTLFCSPWLMLPFIAVGSSPIHMHQKGWTRVIECCVKEDVCVVAVLVVQAQPFVI